MDKTTTIMETNKAKATESKTTKQNGTKSDNRGKFVIVPAAMVEADRCKAMLIPSNPLINQ